MKYNYLLFDMDGTLFDYDKAEVQALQKSFQYFKIDYNDSYLELYRKVNKKVWDDYEQGLTTQNKLKIERFRLLAENINISIDEHVMSAVYLDFLSQSTDLLNGAANLLQALYGKAKLYMITNGLKQVQRPRIKNSTVAGFFEDVIISEEVGYAKPDPKIFDIAFQKMHHPAKNDVLIVGDSLTSDIAGGINYGIDTCWFNPNGKSNEHNYQITYTIYKLSELLYFLDTY